LAEAKADFGLNFVLIEIGAVEGLGGQAYRLKQPV